MNIIHKFMINNNINITPESQKQKLYLTNDDNSNFYENNMTDTVPNNFPAFIVSPVNAFSPSES